MPESRSSHSTRMVLGAILVLESLALLPLGVFIALFGGLAGALAFAAGAGGATDTQIAQGFAAIAVTIVTPIAVACALGLAGFLLVVGIARRAIMAAGVLALMAQVAFHVLCEVELHPADVVPFIVHVLTIVVAFRSVPERVARLA